MYTVIPRMKRLPCLAAALACLAAAAFAQTPSNRDIYMYQGADRDKRLVEGARKERQVLFYSTMTVTDGKALAVAFEQRYGVRVNHWRGSAEKIVSRAIAEARARRPEADVFETSSHRAARRLGRSPVLPHRVQQQHRDLEIEGRPGRVEAAATRVRTGRGGRLVALRAAPARGAAVHRVRALERGPGDPEERKSRPDQPAGGQPAQQVQVRDRRPGARARRRRQVGRALLEPLSRRPGRERRRLMEAPIQPPALHGGMPQAVAGLKRELARRGIGLAYPADGAAPGALLLPPIPAGAAGRKRGSPPLGQIGLFP